MKKKLILLIFFISVYTWSSDNNFKRIEKKNLVCDREFLKTKILRFDKKKRREEYLKLCRNGYAEIEYYEKKLNNNLMSVAKEIVNIENKGFYSVNMIDEKEILDEIESIKNEKIEYFFIEKSFENYIEGFGSIWKTSAEIDLFRIFEEKEETQKLKLNNEEKNFFSKYEVSIDENQFSILNSRYEKNIDKIYKIMSIIDLKLGNSKKILKLQQG